MRLLSAYLIALVSVAAPAALGIPLGTSDAPENLSLIRSRAVQPRGEVKNNLGQIGQTFQLQKRVGGSGQAGSSSSRRSKVGGSGGGSGDGRLGGSSPLVKLDLAGVHSSARPNKQAETLTDVQQYANDNAELFQKTKTNQLLVTHSDHKGLRVEEGRHISVTGYTNGVATTGSHIPTGYADIRRGGKTWHHNPGESRASKWNTVQQGNPSQAHQENRVFALRKGAEVPLHLGYDQLGTGSDYHSGQRDDGTYPGVDDPHNPPPNRRGRQNSYGQSNRDKYEPYTRDRRGGSSSQGGYQDSDPYARDRHDRSSSEYDNRG